MRTSHYILSAILLVVLSAAVFAHGAPDTKRVIAHTEKQMADAVLNGCTIVQHAKTITAFSCPKETATALGLQEDVQVFMTDSGANKQVRADLVQNGGNVGAGRTIAVLDTGYNYNHPELASSYQGGYDFVNADPDPMDDNGHGSHVAGIITADGINAKAKGVSPSAGIISGKVLDASGSGYFSSVVAAIYWAIDGPDGIAGTADDFHPDAISMSLGTSQAYKNFCDTVLPDLTTAIQYARSRGTIVIVAAGNSGNAGVSLPGCISSAVSVGAVDSTDKVARFSGRGKALDITAPGVSLYSSWLGTGYATASGTSMATPVVSGIVALIKAAHPEYTVQQVQDALLKTAKDLGTSGWDSSYGYGRVDAYNAVHYT